MNLSQLTSLKQDNKKMLMQIQTKDLKKKTNSKIVTVYGVIVRRTIQKLHRNKEQLFIRLWIHKSCFCQCCWCLRGSLNPLNFTTGTLSVNLLESHKAVKWHHWVLLQRETHRKTDTRGAEWITNMALRYKGINKRMSGSWRAWSLGALTQPRHTN